MEQALGGRPVLKGTALEMRAQFNGLGAALASQYPAPSAVVQTSEHGIGGLNLRIYTPVSPSKEGVLPISIYAHGGGYVMGNLDSEDPFCRALAENTEMVVVSVDYRLAPEHKAPAQLNDMLNALEWVSYKIVIAIIIPEANIENRCSIMLRFSMETRTKYSLLGHQPVLGLLCPLPGQSF